MGRAQGPGRSGDRSPGSRSLTTYPRILPAGDQALVLELGDAIDPALNARVRAIDEALREKPFEGFLESVPTYRSLLVFFDPARIAAAEASAALLRCVEGASNKQAAPPRRHVIPTRYGGEFGPDLEDVARAKALSAEEVVRLHTSLDFTAFLLGFLPGFAYLGTLPESLAMPRRNSPRTRVPKGSVAIAGRQTGIYPAVTPGGWNLLGRAAVRLFDPHAERPSLFAPGDLIRFAATEEWPAEESDTNAPKRPDLPVVEVLEPGLLTSVQDLGRPGFRRFGVTRGGALDEAALVAANRALGNDDGAAGLECTIAGPTLRFLRTTRFAITGADLGPHLDRSDLGRWPVPLGLPVLAREGQTLSFDGRRSGCRAYIALEGGLDVPVVVASRSTELTTGFGGHAGRALRPGDVLGSLAQSQRRSAEPVKAEPAAHEVSVRVVLGPQADHFDEAATARFLGDTWRVGATADRIGCRLEGEALKHKGAAEIVADGMLPGSIQVPPNGLPIVMLGDAPTTGGYPKIATVLSGDLWKLAQLVPGEGRVRFQRS